MKNVAKMLAMMAAVVDIADEEPPLFMLEDKPKTKVRKFRKRDE